MIDFLFFNGIIYHKHIKNMAQSKPVQKKEDQPETPTIDYPEEEINAEDIPF